MTRSFRMANMAAQGDQSCQPKKRGTNNLHQSYIPRQVMEPLYEFFPTVTYSNASAQLQAVIRKGFENKVVKNLDASHTKAV